LVFRDNAKRRWLENFIHPLILKEIINQVKKSGKKISIIEAPLLFESGLDSVMNVNICVYSKMDLIYERLKKRGWDIKEIEKRLKSQYLQDKKIFLSDISIENNGSLKDLEIKIRDLSQVLSRFQI
jgi:dephospho-CoA kinase